MRSGTGERCTAAMVQRLFTAILFIGMLHASAVAGGEADFAFVDGRWTGGVETGSDNKRPEECWASTKFGDGTTLTLARRSNLNWYLRLSNPGWRLPPSRTYAMVTQVDFYRRLTVTAKAIGRTGLEIADIGQIPLLYFIENGHTIDLAADGFSDKFELEGSAKIIGRIRGCFTN